MPAHNKGQTKVVQKKGRTYFRKKPKKKWSDLGVTKKLKVKGSCRSDYEKMQPGSYKKRKKK